MVEKYYSIENFYLKCNINYKKTKYLKLRVKNGELYVNVPILTPIKDIDSFIFKYKDYILKRISLDISKDEKENIKEHQIVTVMDKKFEVLFAHRNFICLDKIYIDINNKISTKEAIMNLFKKDLLKYLTCLTQECYLRLKTDVPCPKVKLRKMKRILGDYSKSENLIKYTTNLIFRPVESYEALVCHELAHILVQNHSKDFYEVVYKICPNYKYLHNRLINEVNL